MGRSGTRGQKFSKEYCSCYTFYTVGASDNKGAWGYPEVDTQGHCHPLARMESGRFTHYMRLWTR